MAIWYGPTNGVSDCSPDLAKMVVESRTGGDPVIQFPSGVFVFNSPVTADLGRAVIRGQSMLSTLFVKAFNGGNFFYANGSSGGGLILENFAVWADASYSVGNFLSMSATATQSPDGFALRNLWVSSGNGGYWTYNLLIDGLARTYPQGIRDGLIDNCYLFNATAAGAGLFLRNAVATKVRDTGFFTGARLVITGGANSNQKTTACHFRGVTVNDELSITNSFANSFEGHIGKLNTDASSLWRINAYCAEVLANNLVNSHVNLLTP